MNPNHCSVCLNDSYIQNNVFVCNHPLCINCFDMLQIKKCPVCRSFNKEYVFILYDKKRRFNFCYLHNLTNFCLHHYDYKSYLNSFLKKRTTKNIIQKVNKYRQGHNFIIVKKQFLDIGEKSDREFFDFIIKNSFTGVNGNILVSNLIHRCKKNEGSIDGLNVGSVVSI